MRCVRGLKTIGFSFALLVLVGVTTMAEVSIADFRQGLLSIPVGSVDRIIHGVELGFTQEGFPADSLLQLIHRLAAIPGDPSEKEQILLLITRALEEGLPINGLILKGHELTGALEEGLPIEGIILEALKGVARGTPLPVIEQGISQRVVLLRGVRDLLFEKEIFATPPGAPQTAPAALPMPRFDQLLIQIADAVSDYLEGGGSPFEGHILYEQVADRLRRLPESVVPAEDVDLILDRIGPENLTQVALAALS